MILIFGFFLNILLGLLSYLVPKNKNQILMGSMLGNRFVGNPKYFFLYCCTNKNTRCKALWITANRRVFYELQKKGFPILFLYSLRGFIAVLCSEYLLFDHNPRDVSYNHLLPGRFNKIETWHGMGVKEVFWRVPPVFNLPGLKQIIKKLAIHESKSYKAIITCSDSLQDRAYSVFQNNNIKIIGYPRNDVFFDKSSVYNNFYEKLKLEQYDKVILYCPTYREDLLPRNPFSKEFYIQLNNYLKSKNFILLDKRHINEEINQDYLSLSNIVDISNKIDDLQDLLVYTDIMITDYSSAFVDFCLTERPIIFYPYDYEEYEKTRGLIDYFKYLPGFIARTETELLNYIKTLDKITLDENYKKKYQMIKNVYHFYQDGKSSERLFNLLIQ